MEKLRIREAIIVEGRYDKNTLSQVVDTLIIETRGFSIFSDEGLKAYITKIAESRGIIIMTDGDGAGFLIRNLLKGAIPSRHIKNAYIPDIFGKERRKTQGSKEGKLGVEGMKPEVIISALQACGATFLDSGGGHTTHSEADRKTESSFTPAFLYETGLSGGRDSKAKRKQLLERLGLPEHLSTSALIEVMNTLFERDEILELIREFEK